MAQHRIKEPVSILVDQGASFYISDSAEPEASNVDVDTSAAQGPSSAEATEKEEPLGNSQADADSKPKARDSDVAMSSAQNNDDGPSQTEALHRGGASAPDADVNPEDTGGPSSGDLSGNLGSASSTEPCVSGNKSSPTKESAAEQSASNSSATEDRRPDAQDVCAPALRWPGDLQRESGRFA